VPLAKGIAVSSSVYHIPASCMRGLGVITNTSPTSAYRSGRHDAAFRPDLTETASGAFPSKWLAPSQKRAARAYVGR